MSSEPRRGLRRRELLGGALALGLCGLRRAEGEEPARLVDAADRCIILYMAGGMAQTDTFDPKPGTKSAGPLRAIRTAAPDLQLGELLPLLAEEARHLAVLRGMVTREGAHERARYLLHTGYVPSGTVGHPDLGALLAQGAEAELDLPPYVAIGGGGQGPGLLGARFAPFEVGDPTRPVEDLAYAEGVDARRWRRRRQLLEAVEKQFARAHPGEETQGHTDVYVQADRLMHAAEVRAFDLRSEPQALRAAYGLGRFGQGCLMARRLIQAGVRVVEVELGGWDTHQDNFTRNRRLCAELDAGFATLLRDLAEQGLLRRTLVLLLSEFGRTPAINDQEGRDHWAAGWSVVLAGGPVRGGQAVGATSPDGGVVVARPVSAQDLHRSVFHAVGLDPGRVNLTRQGRPVRAVDPAGQVIGELFA